MNKQTENTIFKGAVFFSVTILAIAVVFTAIRRQSAEPATYPYRHDYDSNYPNQQHEAAEDAANHGAPADIPRPTLNQIIRAARGWGPIYTYWYGEIAPDFTFADITGKQHRLSDYRGRNVLINFWASWCIPCLTEIPHLITLRNTISQDKLAILAISDEPPSVVKNAAERYKINYTVFSTDTRSMSKPYRNITSLPTNFFIDQKGKIKLATEGRIPLHDIKAVLEAER